MQPGIGAIHPFDKLAGDGSLSFSFRQDFVSFETFQRVLSTLNMVSRVSVV